MPETLTRAGYVVLVQGGPQPDNYSVYEVRDGEVVSRRTGRSPTAVDLVYLYRPVEELQASRPWPSAWGQRRVAAVRGGQRRDEGLGWLLDGSGGVAGGARGRSSRSAWTYIRGPLYR